MLRSRRKSRDESSSEGRTFLGAFVPSAETLARGRRWAVRIGVLLFLCGLVWTSAEVRNRVLRDHRFFLDTWRIDLTSLPGWVTPEIREEIDAITLTATAARLNVFDRGVLKQVKAVVESSPWVERVLDARLRYPHLENPGSLELTLLLRHPVALVEHEGLYYLVDAKGVRLGSPYRECPSEWFKVPAITGLRSPGPVPAEGERWASRDVAQGIEVARLLSESGVFRDFPERPVRAIDLSNLHGHLDVHESEVALWVGRQKIGFGRSPLSAGANTVPVPTLLANLRYVLAHEDEYGGYSKIDLHRRTDLITGVRG